MAAQRLFAGIALAAALLCLPIVARAQQLSPTPSGLTAAADGSTLELTALRGDALSVRLGRGNAMPENASWAVLPAARTSRAPVTAKPPGFAPSSSSPTSTSPNSPATAKPRSTPHRRRLLRFHNPDGSVDSGIVWPDPAVFPDLTRAQIRQWWRTLYKDLIADGVVGFGTT